MILLALRCVTMKAIFPADTVLVICPHCELESLYQSDEIRCEQEQQRH